MALEDYKTQTGERPDLLAVEANPHLGYIGTQVLPKLNVLEKSGSITYQTLTADSAVQTGRNAGTAPTAAFIAQSTTSYATAENIKRYGVEWSEAKSLGIAQSDITGAKASKRSVSNAIEEAIAAAVLQGAGINVLDIDTSFVDAVQKGLNNIKRYPGQKALVTSYSTFNKLMRYTEIVNRFSLSSAAVSGVDALAIVSRNPASLKMLLASIIGVDQVLIGDDQFWAANATRADRAALVALPGADAFSHKLDPVFGKTMVFLPDGANELVINSHASDYYVSNFYDAISWFQVLRLNNGACQILSGIDEANAVAGESSSSSSES